MVLLVLLQLKAAERLKCLGTNAIPAISSCLHSPPCPLQIVAMIPPTPSNLSCYAAWLPKSKSEMAFLAANCKGASAQQVIMRPGETLLIPGQPLPGTCCGSFGQCAACRHRCWHQCSSGGWARHCCF